MTYDITPGVYRNTNTGIEFELTLDDENDEVIIHDRNGVSDLEIRRDQGQFWFNTLDATGPTYELVEPFDDTSEPTESPENMAEYDPPTNQSSTEMEAQDANQTSTDETPTEITTASDRSV